MAEEEKVLDIQKNYSEEIIQEIQHALDTNVAEIKIIKTVEDLPTTIYMDGAKVVFTNNGRYDVGMFMEISMDTPTMIKWKTTPLPKFYMKDWKRLNKDINIFENNNYLEIKFKVKDADVTALLRRVDLELAEDSFLLMEYGDIMYNNAQYTIIKAFVPTIGEGYWKKSILENVNIIEKLYDSNGYEVSLNGTTDRDDDIEMVSLNDVPDIESEELF